MPKRGIKKRLLNKVRSIFSVHSKSPKTLLNESQTNCESSSKGKMQPGILPDQTRQRTSRGIRLSRRTVQRSKFLRQRFGVRKTVMGFSPRVGSITEEDENEITLWRLAENAENVISDGMAWLKSDMEDDHNDDDDESNDADERILEIWIKNNSFDKMYDESNHNDNNENHITKDKYLSDSDDELSRSSDDNDFESNNTKDSVDEKDDAEDKNTNETAKMKRNDDASDDKDEDGHRDANIIHDHGNDDDDDSDDDVFDNNDKDIDDTAFENYNKDVSEVFSYGSKNDDDHNIRHHEKNAGDSVNDDDYRKIYLSGDESTNLNHILIPNGQVQDRVEMSFINTLIPADHSDKPDRKKTNLPKGAEGQRQHNSATANKRNIENIPSIHDKRHQHEKFTHLINDGKPLSKKHTNDEFLSYRFEFTKTEDRFYDESDYAKLTVNQHNVDTVSKDRRTDDSKNNDSLIVVDLNSELESKEFDPVDNFECTVENPQFKNFQENSGQDFQNERHDSQSECGKQPTHNVCLKDALSSVKEEVEAVWIRIATLETELDIARATVTELRPSNKN